MASTRYAIHASSTKLFKNSDNFDFKQGWYNGRMVYDPNIIKIVKTIRKDLQKTFVDEASATDFIKTLPQNRLTDTSITAYTYKVLKIEALPTPEEKLLRAIFGEKEEA